jgi:hypothetical protein
MLGSLAPNRFLEPPSGRDFTAQMEEQLDEVEQGAVDWVKLLREFYGPFEKDLGAPRWRCATSSGKRSRPRRSAKSAARRHQLSWLD